MNESTLGTGSPEETLLGELAGEFSRRLAEGENPSIEEYAQQYPPLADAIRDVFPALGLLRDSDIAGGVLEESSEPPKSLGEFRILREDVGADQKRGHFGDLDTTGRAVAERSRMAAELRKTAFAQKTVQRTARRGSLPSF